MSEYRMMYCIGCDKRIEKRPSEAFNYTETADGPYCDFCWHFIIRIEALSQRVSDLETNFKLSQQSGCAACSSAGSEAVKQLASKIVNRVKL